MAIKKKKDLNGAVKIQPKTKEDYRAVVRIAEDENKHYHTFARPEDKLIHVVFRGIIISTTKEEILQDLEEMGFYPQSVCVGLMEVRTVEQRRRKEATQCHRC